MSFLPCCDTCRHCRAAAMPPLCFQRRNHAHGVLLPLPCHAAVAAMLCHCDWHGTISTKLVPESNNFGLESTKLGPISTRIDPDSANAGLDLAKFRLMLAVLRPILKKCISKI